MASVEIAGVRKSFGTTEVLHGVDVEIPDGEFVVLVGPSGCGKSTLLRLIAGLEEISSGEISIDGRVVNFVHPKERDIAMVFQNYALYPHMTVYQNMAFSLRLRRARREEMDRAVAKAASILNLGEFLGRYPRQLSGGQRQRVAMGRAIVRDPKVFLFDEPLSNLDAKLRVQMRAEIKELHQNLKTTTVYVTHDQIEAMTMADRMVIMNEGRVEQIGAPLEVYDTPVNRFVAGFIGSPAMNFLEGSVRDGAIETATGVMLPLPESHRVENGRRITYGVRPEHIALGSGTSGIGVEVSVVEPTGSETLVVGRAGDEEIHVVFHERHSFTPRRADPRDSRSRPHPPLRARGRRADLIPRLSQRHILGVAPSQAWRRREASRSTREATSTSARWRLHPVRRPDSRRSYHSALGSPRVRDGDCWSAQRSERPRPLRSA